MVCRRGRSWMRRRGPGWGRGTSPCSTLRTRYQSSYSSSNIWWPMPVFLIGIESSTFYIQGFCLGVAWWCGREVVWRLACFGDALTWLCLGLKSPEELIYSPQWGSTVWSIVNRPIGRFAWTNHIYFQVTQPGSIVPLQLCINKPFYCTTDVLLFYCRYSDAIVLTQRFPIMYLRGVLGNKCAGWHNLKMVYFKKTSFLHHQLLKIAAAMASWATAWQKTSSVPTWSFKFKPLWNFARALWL